MDIPPGSLYDRPKRVVISKWVGRTSLTSAACALLIQQRRSLIEPGGGRGMSASSGRKPHSDDGIEVDGHDGLDAESEFVGRVLPMGWERATPAEREVVRHVVQGLSNRETGERLFVSARTVETHLSHVYAKLGISSRVELTGVVMRNPTLRAGLAEESPALTTRNSHRSARQA
jgi:DNA-binding CsgD family transcriptional regulator